VPTEEPTQQPNQSPTQKPTQIPTNTPTEKVTLAQLIVPKGQKVIPNQYIVVYNDSIKASDYQKAISSTIEANGGKIGFVYDKALNGFSAYLPDKALQAVRANSAIKYVEADTVVSINDGDDISTDDITDQAVQTSPTWGLDRIDQRNLPLDSRYVYSTTASSVHVYIIDTGILSTHTQFGGRATKDYDVIGDGQNGNDCAGHGTHVAGTIGSSTYGVAKGVRFHAVRFLNCSGSGTTSGVIAGINCD